MKLCPFKTQYVSDLEGLTCYFVVHFISSTVPLKWPPLSGYHAADQALNNS